MSTSIFTPLVQSTNSVGTTVPAGFNPQIAYLLGECCNLTYTQYGEAIPTPFPPPAVITPAVFAQNLTAVPNATYQQIGDGLYASEAIGLGTIATQPGGFRTVPFGFAVQVSVSGTPAYNIIALRGTRSYQEWVNDLEAIPTFFALNSNSPLVHGGFYGLYTTGTDGTAATSTTPRPPGSLAAQIQAIVTGPGWDSSLPLYITGHSLGGGLAVICALDVASNFAGSYSAINMYSLAGPRTAAGGAVSFLNFGVDIFLDAYQKLIPGSYRIVNAADIIPILPPAAVTLGPATVDFAHVTDQSASNGAPNLTGNVVSFCAQTGEIGGNHSIVESYLPYLQQLAAGFS